MTDRLFIDGVRKAAPKPETEPNTVTLVSSPDTVTLTKDQLAEIIQEAQSKATRVPEIEKGVGDWKLKNEEPSENPKARMRLYQKDGNSPFGLVIDLHWVRDEYDEKTRAYDRQIYEFKVLYDDGSEERVEMPLLDFAKTNNFETVEIIKTDRKMLQKTSGKVRVSGKDREGYTRSAPMGSGQLDNVVQGDYVDLVEEKAEELHTVKRENGKTLELMNRVLNL